MTATILNEAKTKIDKAIEVAKEDFAPSTKDFIETVAETKRKLGFVVYVYETYVTRKNFMNGVEFKERYDTPSYCSPSSESYWSM